MGQARVFVTHQLKSYWESKGNKLATLSKAFAEWVESSQEDKARSVLFGKDGAYDAPLIDGKRLLRHVHLVPLVDKDAEAKWYERLRFGSRKTSDRALVYASDGFGCHLLIYILEEPDAHRVAKMRSPEHVQIMEGFAATAVNFFNHHK